MDQIPFGRLPFTFPAGAFSFEEAARRADDPGCLLIGAIGQPAENALFAQRDHPQFEAAFYAAACTQHLRWTSDGRLIMALHPEAASPSEFLETHEDAARFPEHAEKVVKEMTDSLIGHLKVNRDRLDRQTRTALADHLWAQEELIGAKEWPGAETLEMGGGNAAASDAYAGMRISSTSDLRPFPFLAELDLAYGLVIMRMRMPYDLFGPIQLTGRNGSRLYFPR